MVDTNRLIYPHEWVGIGIVSGIAYLLAKYGLKEKDFEAEKKNCGCGKDPCITYGAEPCSNYGAESFETEGGEEPETITHVIVLNEGESGNSIRKKIRNAFDKVGYQISPVPKKLKGLTYLGSNSNPVETFIYNEHINKFRNALEEQGLSPLFAEVFNSYWDIPDKKMKHYNKVGWPAPDSTELEYINEYHDAESFGAEDSRRRLKELMEGKSKEERKRISKMVQIKGMENTIAELLANAEAFAATTFDEDDDKPSNYEFVRDTSENEFKDDCEICARPFAINKLGQKLIQHYLKESDNGFKEWKNKKNPDGTRRTARNITGFFLYDYGLDALNQYVLFQDKTGISEKVIELLRLSLVERIVAGDVINLIEMMDMQDEVDDTPTFGKGFEKDFMAEN